MSKKLYRSHVRHFHVHNFLVVVVGSSFLFLNIKMPHIIRSRFVEIH